MNPKKSDLNQKNPIFFIFFKKIMIFSNPAQLLWKDFV